MSSKKIFLKDKVKPVPWVGHLQIRSLDTNDLFQRTPCVDEKQASVTENTTKQSFSCEKNNPVLLQ